MKITVLEGESFVTATAQQAAQRVHSQGSSNFPWVDMRLDDGDDAEASRLLEDLGVDPIRALATLRSSVELSFRLTPSDLHGVVWLDDNDGSSARLVLFHWTKNRFLTVRFGGGGTRAWRSSGNAYWNAYQAWPNRQPCCWPTRWS